MTKGRRPSDDTYTRRDDVGSRRTRLANADEAVGGIDLTGVKSCANLKERSNDKDEHNDTDYVDRNGKDVKSRKPRRRKTTLEEPPNRELSGELYGSG